MHGNKLFFGYKHFCFLLGSEQNSSEFILINLSWMFQIYTIICFHDQPVVLVSTCRLETLSNFSTIYNHRFFHGSYPVAVKKIYKSQ